MYRAITVFFILFVAIAAVLFVSCGGGTSGNTSQTAMVNVTTSDPAPCGGNSGPFAHVFLTIADVKIHQSADAGPNDAGWVDLTPGLSSKPQQVDMLGIANNQCFLATLGSSELTAGNYQQIRIFLLADSQSSMISNNQCGAASNCVVLNAQPNIPVPLQLSSEATTGIKIPSGQIGGGQFSVAPGQVKDLNIDFNACESIVVQGNGQYRLKPVLHAGEVNTTQSSITGNVVDTTTGQPIVGGNTVVVLEQTDSSGVDRVIMENLTGSQGEFVFCPVPSGTYDVVIVAINGAGTAYAATVITGVHPGAMGTVPLTPAAQPASITGAVTSSTGSAAISVDLSVSALQAITVNGSAVKITTPLAQQGAATATLTTAAGMSCPANTDCVSYTLAIPAANPSVGAFVAGGPQTPAPPASGTVAYSVDAQPFAAGLPDCNPSDAQTSQNSSNSTLTVTAGNSFTASTLAFTGCQ